MNIKDVEKPRGFPNRTSASMKKAGCFIPSAMKKTAIGNIPMRKYAF